MSVELDGLVARLQPVRDEDLELESATADAKALFEHIVAHPDDGTVLSEELRDPPLRTWRWLVVVAAAAVVGTVALLTVDGGPAPELATPAAAALRDAADAARAQDGIPPGAYLYVRSDNAVLAFGKDGPGHDCCEALVPRVRELWLGDEPGDARLRERREGELQFLTEQERARWIRLGRPALESKTPFSAILTGIPTRAWYDGPLDLPTDPGAVYEDFEKDAEADHAQPGAPTDVDVGGSMFLHFADVLREARATPEQRAAAYEALARVPGLMLVGDVTDRLGRPGVAIALDVGDNEPSGFLYRHVLVFDRGTADLLEERMEVLPGNRNRGLFAGMVYAYATYEYSIVGALGKRPRTN
jgi:hypothetical protein